MIQAIMLDVDGVLIDDSRLWTSELKRDLGVDPSDLQSRFFTKHWHKIVVGAAPIEPALELALRQIGTTVTATQLMDYWFAQDAQLNTSLLDELPALRKSGLQIHLTTNQDHARAAYLMETLDLNSHVDGIVYSAAMGARKPHRAFFDAARNATGLPADAHILIDDKPDNIKGAQKAGWHGHHWTGKQTLSAIIKAQQKRT